MANPDIPAALVVLQAHLVAAGAALDAPNADVARGLPTGGRQIRHYYAGETDAVKMPGQRVLNAELVGVRFEIVALWPLTDTSPALWAVIDAEMQDLANEIRTRLDGDCQLGGNVTDMTLGYCNPDLASINGARHVAARWTLDLSFLEYPVAA